ncbi:hypothetical protein [Pectobacterium versatile]|uniref:hypothetical protein n=1 Tax=Pectobacterium versatile TaxID=2488639 RepID=UPI001F334F43|nr:hypothetical protein [Pectobacterium versatile]
MAKKSPTELTVRLGIFGEFSAFSSKITGKNFFLGYALVAAISRATHIQGLTNNEESNCTDFCDVNFRLIISGDGWIWPLSA